MSHERPFFSIITPTFNRAHFLEEMIASVQAQTFSDHEHIIVDDGSTDGTEELLKPILEADSRILYIKQENKGRSVARNVGIEAAKGEYICFLDSDDVWLPKHLETIHQATAKHENPTFFHAGLIWFYDDGSPEHLVQYAARDTFSSDVEYVIANQFAPDCVCIHREILQKDLFNPKLFINEDVELWVRIAAHCPVVGIGLHTAKLRVHGGNTDKEVNDNITPRMEAFKLMLDNPTIRKQLSPPFIKDRKRGLDELQLRYFERSGQRGKLLTAILSFLMKYPGNPRNSAKVVTFLYNLPGGSLLKSLIARMKSGNR
ncbi:MAG: glycosyltransferase [Flavobacteriales bacterium]|nr:glycosyltransferase [Flavobacteriales bacterium]